jgi:threonine aldolase
MFGMEAGLFCPSGTMTNQIAINCHTRPADEVICEKTSHIYQYEGGGIAFNSGCQVKLIDGDRGRINATQIEQAINPDDVHKPVSRLVSLENTSNRGGGSCYEMADIIKIRELCLNKKMKLHLDGARLWNALVAKNETPVQYGELFDSISICLSKGLGAPVGSVLLGSKEFIARARRVRKLFGGGMRQAGYMAAAGHYALLHHRDRLKDDHRHAAEIATALARKSWIRVMPVETNILIFEVHSPFDPPRFVDAMKKEGIQCMSISPGQVRMVTHLGVTEEMTARVIHAIDALPA